MRSEISESNKEGDLEGSSRRESDNDWGLEEGKKAMKIEKELESETLVRTARMRLGDGLRGITEFTHKDL